MNITPRFYSPRPIPFAARHLQREQAHTVLLTNPLLSKWLCDAHRAVRLNGDSDHLSTVERSTCDERRYIDTICVCSSAKRSIYTHQRFWVFIESDTREGVRVRVCVKWPACARKSERLSFPRFCCDDGKHVTYETRKQGVLGTITHT